MDNRREDAHLIRNVTRPRVIIIPNWNGKEDTTPPHPRTHAHTLAHQPQAACGQATPRLMDRRCASGAASGDRGWVESGVCRWQRREDEGGQLCAFRHGY